jgi:crossover junction endodeoxyribonuclease RusA
MSAEPVAFVVRGVPVPQGSSRAFVGKGKNGKPRAFVATEAHTDSPLGSWRTAIAQEAREAMGDRPLLEGPLKVWLTFVFPRPASHFLPANSRRPVRELRADAPTYLCTKPDLDKLLRAALDAMTGVVWRDDGQVAAFGHPQKIYETALEQQPPAMTHRPGVEVHVRPIG